MAMIRKLKSQYFPESIPLAAIDYYEKNSRGRDDFSRKQAWFYSYGDKEIAEEFKRNLLSMFETLFRQDDLEWDMITLYPTHAKGQVNPNLRALFLEIGADSGIPLNQVLNRTKNVRENHMMEEEKAKAINLDGSIEVDGDVEGKNIILVDNISLSGVSMLHGANLLKNQGAKNVFSVSLGTDSEYSSVTRELRENETARDIMSGNQVEVEKG